MKTITIDGVEYSLTPIKKTEPIILEQNLKFEVYPNDLGECNWQDAKSICEDLGDGWRLPTIKELNIMRFNKDTIGGFKNAYYWSSTDYCTNYAWIQLLTNGFECVNNKGVKLFVRAVRDIKE